MARKLAVKGTPSGFMVLDNPEATPPVDRKRLVSPRAEQFGFEVHPNNINDMSVGEASAGVSQFRRAQFYSSIGGPAGTNVDEFVYNNAIGIATARSMDTRPRFWHVSFFAVSVISAAGSAPLTEAEILSTAGRGPTNTTLKGRVQVFDESGSRFYDVNIHGTSGFSFYGFGVTTSILLPQTVAGVPLGSEVNAIDPGATPILLGGIENTLATGRIIPTFQNVTQITDQVTRTVTVPSAAAGGSAFMPIPPGARAVRLRKSTVGAVLGATYFIGFSSAPSAARPAALGVINRLVGRDETQLIAVPNATFIAFTAGGGDPEADWVATFVVEV